MCTGTIISKTLYDEKYPVKKISETAEDSAVSEGV
jgi:hypothetical protein